MSRLAFTISGSRWRRFQIVIADCGLFGLQSAMSQSAIARDGLLDPRVVRGLAITPDL
jgi:hypothetical protein